MIVYGTLISNDFLLFDRGPRLHDGMEFDKGSAATNRRIVDTIPLYDLITTQFFFFWVRDHKAIN